MPSLIDLKGRKFGLFTVIERTKSLRPKKVTWLCRCECGVTKPVISDSLLSGKSKCCGCTRLNVMIKAVKTHGLSGTKFYYAYNAMLKRCYRKNGTDWKYYGGRGIYVSIEWRESFEVFRKDMYKKYEKHLKKYGSKNTTLDRIDVNGPYSKENCRWATMKEQANNKRIKYGNTIR